MKQRTTLRSPRPDQSRGPYETGTQAETLQPRRHRDPHRPSVPARADHGAQQQEERSKRTKVDLFWSGKHHCHGGNVQVLTAPDGWPLWVSGVRPGREQDVTAARHDPDLLATLGAWCDEQHAVLADLGYEGERGVLTLPVRTEANGTDDRGHPIPLTADQACHNALHSATRARAEAGNAWLEMTFKILRRVRINPWRIGALAAAALVLLHALYDRTARPCVTITPLLGSPH